MTDKIDIDAVIDALQCLPVISENGTGKTFYALTPKDRDKTIAALTELKAREGEHISGLIDAAENLDYCIDFMQNGFELGYIKKPEQDDPAHKRLPETCDALKRIKAILAKTNHKGDEL